MKKTLPVIMATAFASTSIFAIFISSAHMPQDGGHVALLSGAPQAALADRDDRERGNSDECANAAGHEKGWCRHGRDHDERGDRDDWKHHKHHRHHGSTGFNTISGTVTSVNGAFATIRLDNGQYVNVQENGTRLNVGQHYTLNGCYQGNVFVLGCYANNNYPTGNNRQISGTILSVSGNTLTLAGVPPVSVDISRAVSNGEVSGPLTPLRHVTIYGYYQNGTFYATSVR